MEVTSAAILMGIAASIFIVFFAFGILSLKEGERRAARISMLIGVLGASFYMLMSFTPFQIRLILLSLHLALILITALALLLPAKSVVPVDGERRERFDEREVLFARRVLSPGSTAYQQYYAMHPEHLKYDEGIQKLSGLLASHAKNFDPLIFPTASASFEVTAALRHAVDGTVAATQTAHSSETRTRYVKGLARHLGAVSVGITLLNPGHVYSHVGRGSGTYGAPIQMNHRYAIAFSLEMDHAIMSCAPQAAVILETARKYVESAVIAIQIANWIRLQGFPARAHIDENYRVIEPLVARDAGLGEIGRMGILMTPELGPRVRLGVVTTDMPLDPDLRNPDPSVFEFCGKCTKCAENCPSKAIPFGEAGSYGGGRRWKLDEEKCFHYWNVIGTDCGICMSVCPYSHPNNWGHNTVRSLIRRSAAARRAALYLDNLFYGRKPSTCHPPEWLSLDAGS